MGGGGGKVGVGPVGLPFEVVEEVGWWVVVEEESVVLVGHWAFLLRLWWRWVGGWRWACLPSEWRRLPRPSPGWASVTSVHAHRLVYHPP